MTDDEAEWERLALDMPCDEELLAPIGRVTWAAARLHAGVRDAINFIDGEPSDAPFQDWALGTAITRLEQRAGNRVADGDRSAIISWCRHTGRPAKNARDAVTHAITYTAPDGRQAIMTNDHSSPGRFLGQDLLRVAGRLEQAFTQLPRPPFVLEP